MASDSPLVLHRVEQVRGSIRDFRRREPHGIVAFVPTMGALHDGHLELVRRARLLPAVDESGTSPPQPQPPLLVVVSIFVNPLQFGPNEDFHRYPRTLTDDLTKLEGLAKLVFVPEAAEILGTKANGNESVRVSAGRLGKVLEGERRPNYFDGVLTIVAKLFNIVQPDVALFGQKDAQQLVAIQQMVNSLHFPIRVFSVETHREPDGVAMSSRNRYLSSQERQDALSLWNALKIAQLESEEGKHLAEVMARARTAFEEKAEGRAQLDYLVAVNPSTFEEVNGNFKGKILLLIAAFFGDTRLIDNIETMIKIK